VAAQQPYSEVLLSREECVGLSHHAELWQAWENTHAAWAEHDRELRRLYAEDAHLGWDGFSTQPIAVRHVPGDHKDMIHEPHVQLLAAILQDTLRAAQDRAATRAHRPPAVASYPLSKVQEGLWLLQKFSPHPQNLRLSP
jgi:hypothetical protein